MNIPNLLIRAETANDYPKVYNVNTEAFGRSDEARLVDRVRSGGTFIQGLSLVASIDDKIVGHILLSKIEIVSEGSRHESLALAPMAVLPEFQRTGIGTELVKQGLEKARGLGYNSVIVLGHEHFYPKFNFRPAKRWNIKAPFNVPESNFMALELIKGALDNVKGTVEYPTGFDV